MLKDKNKQARPILNLKTLNVLLQMAATYNSRDVLKSMMWRPWIPFTGYPKGS